MVPVTPSRWILLAIISCLFITETTAANSVCANWWKNQRQSGAKPKMRVKLIRRTEGNNGQIGRMSGAAAGRKTAYLAPGTGACSIPYTDEDHGACLWTGLNSVDSVPTGQQPGWLSGTNTDNCKKKFFINRGDNQATGTVLDACSFADGNDLTTEQGCSTIYVTLSTYIQLGGQKGDSGRIEIDNWDFDPSTPPC